MAGSATQTITVAGWLEPRWLSRRGQWQVRLRYRHPATGKRTTHAEVFVDASDADEARQLGGELLLEQRLELTRRLSDRNRDRTARAETVLEDFIEDVWKGRTYTKLPQNSKDGHDRIWSKWIQPYIGGFTLQELADDGPEIGAAWVKQMQADGAGVPTIEKAINMTRGYVSRAIEWEHLRGITTHPLRHVVLPAREFKEEIEFALEIEHVELIAWLTPGPLRNVLWTELIGCEALRQQEFGCLNWSDAFLPRWRPREALRITKAISGSGTKREIKDLKSRQSGRRTPTLWKPIVPVFEAVRDDEGVPEVAGRVFACDSWDKLPERRNWLVDVFYPTLKRAAIEQDGKYGHLTPHRLRGAAASALGYALMPKHEMLAFVGHTQETTTITWYQRAYENPDPDLVGMPLPEQITRARALALPKVRVFVEEWEAKTDALAASLQAAGTKQEKLKLGSKLTAHRRELGELRKKLALLESLV